MSHTDGPWVVFACDGAAAVLPAMRAGEICSGIKNDADARLIAAAPALLAALEAIVNSTDYGSPLSGDDERPLMQAARAAIRSARDE